MRIVCFLATLLVASSASAALNAYLHLSGEIQGEVRIVDMKLQKVPSPRDAASGQATGKRQHGFTEVVVFFLTLDKSSPLLAAGLEKGKTIKELNLRAKAGGRGVTIKKGYIAARVVDGDHVRVEIHAPPPPKWRKLAAKVRGVAGKAKAKPRPH